MVRRFLPYLRPVRFTLALGLAASVLQASMQWLAPWPLKVIFDSVMAHRPVPALMGFLPATPEARLNVLVILMLAIAVLLGVFSFGATRLVAEAGQRVVYDIRQDLFGHIQAQSLAFHQRRTAGDLLTRLGGDAQALQGVMVNAVPTLVSNVLTLAGMLAIMLVLDWRYTLLALSLMPLIYVTIRYFLRNIKAAQRDARRWEGESATIAQEVLTSITAVQAFGREPDEAARFGRATSRGLDANRRTVVLQAAFTPIMAATMTVATVLVLWLGARSVIHGRLTPGDLLVFMAYLRGMYSPVRQLAKLAGVVGRGIAAGERIAEILDTDERVPELPGARDAVPARGALSLRDVGFQYAGGPEVLSGVDLEVPAGTRLALVGVTGSGKSTLLRLIPRFLDPSSGAVLLDGADVRELTLESLRCQIALVPQEPYIFRGTVWENIAYGGRGMSREAAIAAAHAAGVHQVLSKLSGGYDTVVAERGATLSGGQRQCVALARAMARNPRVLLLDEPTTGLDARAQGMVLAALDRVSEGRTTIVVSHDAAAVRGADVVATIERGRIVDVGSPRELLERRPTVSWANRPVTIDDKVHRDGRLSLSERGAL